jgi:hypothetical protein
VIAASGIGSVIPDPYSAGAFLAALAIRGVAEGLVEAAIGLTLVELCYRLIALQGTPGLTARTPAAGHRPSSQQHR